MKYPLLDHEPLITFLGSVTIHKTSHCTVLYIIIFTTSDNATYQNEALNPHIITPDGLYLLKGYNSIRAVILEGLYFLNTYNFTRAIFPKGL